MRINAVKLTKFALAATHIIDNHGLSLDKKCEYVKSNLKECQRFMAVLMPEDEEGLELYELLKTQVSLLEEEHIRLKGENDSQR